VSVCVVIEIIGLARINRDMFARINI